MQREPPEPQQRRLFQLTRLGIVMAPNRDDPREIEGVLNPAAARGPDGQLYLFPRLVGRGNFSRIGIARVRFGGNGDPVGVERLGIALEPETDYELHPGGGGCEDPRISFVEPLQRYVMTYTAFGPQGPRIALASSKDLFLWERLGLATFQPCDDLEGHTHNFTDVNNKDALFFPVALRGPDGEPSFAMIHRPLFPGTDAGETVHDSKPRKIDVSRESMWISYSPCRLAERNLRRLCDFHAHHRLACPVAPWEHLKIGGGTPPILTQHGWLVFYHAVCESTQSLPKARRLRYSAGALLLSEMRPMLIRYRSSLPVLEPELPEERTGVVANVVFPTAVDRRLDLGQPNRIDVYYGMADTRIGAAVTDIPKELPDPGPSLVRKENQ